MRWSDLRIRDQPDEEIVAEISARIASGRGGVAAVLNANKLGLAREDRLLQRHLLEADWLLADGISIPLLQRLRGEPASQRVCGIDLAEGLLRAAGREGWRVALLGGRPDVIGDAADTVLRNVPGVELAVVQHGYAGRQEGFLNALATTQPQLVLLALGTPAQEHFQQAHREELAGAVVLGVGGAFDVWAGRQPRAPSPMRKAGLEWAWRVAHEPRTRGPRLVRSLIDLALGSAL